MIAEYAGIIPTRGDRVRVGEQPGLLEVADVNMLMQTATLKSTDEKGHLTGNVSWSLLHFLAKK